ncbi:membrane protein DedA with SNARE-associated domain [Anoxybacillus voinovskiensis]|uniref:Membrane protein DedA with SNARE-associated domain n=1 Tax=Anoxybacteroides voinovskiense TaxID=230470 RepID=A0A840E0F2_9BACL|nr:membrane protein DedA with SNARE-associated domain [Anoxybacillus voinovskiensis]
MYISNGFALIVFSLLFFLLGISGIFRLTDPMGLFDRVLGFVLVVLGFLGAFLGMKTWWGDRKLRKKRDRKIDRDNIWN